MSKIFIFYYLLFQSYFLLAQEESSTISDSSNISVFLSAGMDYGTAYGNKAFTLDINGGFEYNNIYFGGFGCSIINDIEINEDTTYKNMQMDLGYGGFVFGYDFFSGKKIHLFTGTQAGWGVVSLSKKQIANKVEYMERIYYDNVFLLKPLAMIEISVTQHFFVNAGATYIIMGGLTKLSGFSNSDFNNINYILSLKYHL